MHRRRNMAKKMGKLIRDMVDEETAKTLQEVMDEIAFVPERGKSESPCSECVGLIQCLIKKQRNPDIECNAFYSVGAPLDIRMMDDTE